MSSRKFIWTVNQLRFYAKFPYLKIRKNSQDFAKKLHFNKNYRIVSKILDLILVYPVKLEL
jgi:hypothetical protein